MPAMVLTLVLMSMARAYVADMLGDPTPRERGMLSLNPVNHVDPVGTLAIPAMLMLLGGPAFGWGKGFMFDGANYRHPRADGAVVALIGPLVALLIAAIAAVGVAALVDTAQSGLDVPLVRYLYQLMLAMLLTGCMLAIFNLLPIPGFDGGKIVEAFLPRELGIKFAALSQYSLLILVALVAVMPMLSPQLDIIGQVIAPIAFEIARTFLWGAGVAGLG